MYQNLTSNISQSRPHTSSIFMSFSIKSGTLNSKMKWKPEPEVVFRAILAKNQISRFSRPCISAIRLCSEATRSADRSVDRQRFGPPSWTGNRTATTRRSDSDHAECMCSAQQWYIIQRRTVLIIFLLIFQTVIIAPSRNLRPNLTAHWHLSLL